VTSDRQPRRGGITLLATASGPEEAQLWQERLRHAGIQSIVRGHRPEGSAERRPSFSGADVYVSASSLARARETLGADLPVDQTGEADAAFPWFWVALAPTAVLAVAVAGLLVVVLS
jgi:hypothetical protein